MCRRGWQFYIFSCCCVVLSQTPVQSRFVIFFFLINYVNIPKFRKLGGGASSKTLSKSLDHNEPLAAALIFLLIYLYLPYIFIHQNVDFLVLDFNTYGGILVSSCFDTLQKFICINNLNPIKKQV